MSRQDGADAPRGKKRKRGRKHGAKRVETKARAVPSVVPERPDLLQRPDLAERPGRPPGQRLYDMPFSSAEPRLIKPELGLHNLVARSGPNAGYAIDVTLLDAPDHRLIRSGVLLAHRVVDERGEWFLTAPDWQPLLPKDRVEPMGHADLPDDLASLIRPLRRRATLGPVAALRCERREFALRDDRGTTLALLRDDKVTVRRGGLTTARYREVMLTPVGPGLDDEQRAFTDRAFVGAGATRVPRFPRLVTRLGAPATGPSDIPEPGPPDPDASLRRFVAAVIGSRLHEIVRCDLAVRGGDLGAGVRFGAQAASLRDALAGLSGALEPDWAEDLTEDMDWLVGLAAALPERVAALGGSEGALSARLRSERYLSLLERLVNAARAPRLRVDGSQAAASALAGLLEAGTAALGAAVDTLTVDDDARAWAAVRGQLESLRQLAALATEVAPTAATPVAVALAKPGRRLDAVRADAAQPEPDLTELSAAQAFAAGRSHERAVAADRLARQAFLDAWAKAARTLS